MIEGIFSACLKGLYWQYFICCVVGAGCFSFSSAKIYIKLHDASRIYFTISFLWWILYAKENKTKLEILYYGAWLFLEW